MRRAVVRLFSARSQRLCFAVACIFSRCVRTRGARKGIRRNFDHASPRRPAAQALALMMGCPIDLLSICEKSFRTRTFVKVSVLKLWKAEKSPQRHVPAVRSIRRCHPQIRTGETSRVSGSPDCLPRCRPCRMCTGRQ